MPDPLYTTPLATAYYNTLVDPAIATCFNCRKDSYFTLFYLELKDKGNIKEIEEEEMSKELGKEEP